MAIPLAEIDRAIAACLQRGSDQAFSDLCALGPEALHRVEDIYHGRARWNPPKLDLSGREALDQWSHMRYVLALSHPDAYLEHLAARRVRFTTSEVVTLGDIDDVRVIPLLVDCVRHHDWLVRYHAIRGLVRRDHPAAVGAVERAAREDCSVMVRFEAVNGIARRDRARARQLYLGLLEHPHLTPLLKNKVKFALGE